MASKDLTLTSDWQQITDGTQDVQLQVLGGTIWLRDSAKKPTANAKGHIVSTMEWIGITSPQQMWGRSQGGNASIIVT
ncbi:hypothetical protein A6J33_018080 [Pantoea sp. FDAARGOS_194]|uniref:hypothetical protein n=1 Tax=Pantoea TaxID=53335 RepID=UPI000BB58A0D|nr:MULTISPECIES: hypothetical protein [Pantoea]PNK64554.1 hypothetical protein A6J33_018080 [Pantoea sp. FDAARGOS_194]